MSGAQWDRRKLYEHAPGGSRYWAAGREVIERAAEEEALRIDVPPAEAITAYSREVLGEEAPGTGLEP